jgi:uncharacterized membrane protein
MAVETTHSQPQPVASPAQRTASWFEAHWLFAFNFGWGMFTTLPWLAPVFMQWGWTGPGKAIHFVYNFFCHQLPERSWFLYGPRFSYSLAEIGQVWEIGDPLVRRHFVGNPAMGWKVAWSDRMVAMYTSIFVLGLLYALLRQRGIRWPGLPWWGFFVLIAPLAVDGTTHLVNDALRLDFRHFNKWAVALSPGLFPPEFYVGDLLGSLNSVLRIISGLLFGLGVVWFLWPMMDQELGRRPAAS